MNPIVLIPARMAATRLPGKPLADIGGVPMIVRVLRQAEAAGVGPVAVAAGDAEIVAAVEAAGGRAVLTDPGLPSGSDRILAALAALDPRRRPRRGDQPAGRHALRRARGAARLRRAARGRRLRHLHRGRARSLARRPANPDVVKAVLGLDADGAALAGRSTSPARPWRATRPSGATSGSTATAARRWSASTPPASPLEQREKLEQLRALELGLTIRAGVVDRAPISVDTPRT